MDLMETALLVGLGGVLLGYLLVVRAGFRREFLWGVINLVPVVSLAFVALYWRQARFGFILSILGLLVVAGALFGGADARVERELARLGYDVQIPMPVQRPWDVELSNEETIRRIEAETGERLEMVVEDPFAIPDIQPLPPEGSFRLEERAPVERAWREAVREELPRLVGERLTLTLSAGSMREGVLENVTVASVFLQQRTRQGTVTFEYRLAEVRLIEVWDVKGAEPRLPEPEPESEVTEEIIYSPPEGETPQPEPNP
jgi:hypothetical protein